MIKIRNAKLEDVQDLLNLWQMLMDYHKSLDKKSFTLKKNAKSIMKSFFIKNIKSKNSIVLIAEDKPVSIGYLMGFIQKQPPVYENDKYGFLSDAFIREEYRSTGITKNMTKKAEKFFKNKKLKTLSAKVFSGNKKGIKAWNKIGLKEGAKLIFKTIK